MLRNLFFVCYDVFMELQTQSWIDGNPTSYIQRLMTKKQWETQKSCLI